MSAPLWSPSPEHVAASAMAAFIARVNANHRLKLNGYDALHRWSVEHPDLFWNEIWDDSAVIGDKGSVTLLDADRMPGARFFPEARLNFAENLLRGEGDGPALLFNNEGRMAASVSHAELRADVARLAVVLKS